MTLSPTLLEYSTLTIDTIHRAIRQMKGVSGFPSLRDEGDNHLVELAVAGGAGYIVTRNLRDVSRFESSLPGNPAKRVEVMSALTLRLPDEKYQRLKDMARQRGQSVNRLLDEVTTLLLAEFDAETRFMLQAKRGSGKKKRGLELLAKAGHTQP